MNIRKFNSNSNELRELWVRNGIAINKSLAYAKVLGLRWNNDNDELFIEQKNFEQSSSDSIHCIKHIVLKFAAQIYDSIALISPFVIKMKIFLLKIWKVGLDWNDALQYDINYRV